MDIVKDDHQYRNYTFIENKSALVLRNITVDCVFKKSSYTVEDRYLCSFLHDGRPVHVKVPTGYLSNLKRIVLQITLWKINLKIQQSQIFYFSPKIWAKQYSDRIHTTNPCESFHSDFNSNFYHQHPHIFKIIEILKLFQINTYIKIRTTNTNFVIKINQKHAEKENFINQKIKGYSTKQIHEYDYVRVIKLIIFIRVKII
ncbi:Uncharacterized protein FWK35_00016701 [Aphis craccivora]|uniref:Uncharacterized protein n=1 Tax=Aphis craccivora TaxID=307492 RepID=A0A6G0ZMM0_APHCR|nr:Uncharacterized protein FWK35_00016701 [Aphis craccivora]